MDQGRVNAGALSIFSLPVEEGMRPPPPHPAPTSPRIVYSKRRHAAALALSLVARRTPSPSPSPSLCPQSPSCLPAGARLLQSLLAPVAVELPRGACANASQAKRHALRGRSRAGQRGTRAMTHGKWTCQYRSENDYFGCKLSSQNRKWIPFPTLQAALPLFSSLSPLIVSCSPSVAIRAWRAWRAWRLPVSSHRLACMARVSPGVAKHSLPFHSRPSVCHSNIALEHMHPAINFFRSYIPRLRLRSSSLPRSLPMLFSTPLSLRLDCSQQEPPPPPHPADEHPRRNRGPAQRRRLQRGTLGRI